MNEYNENNGNDEDELLLGSSLALEMQDHSDPVDDYKKDYDIADFIGSSEFQGEEVLLEQ